MQPRGAHGAAARSWQTAGEWGVVDRASVVGDGCAGPLAGVRCAPQDGRTALFVAAYCGSKDAMLVLLAHGADPNAKDNVSPSDAQQCCWPVEDVWGRDAASSAADRARRGAQGMQLGALAQFTVALLCSFALVMAPQDGCGVASECSDVGCRALLLNAERMQRWHRRRRLILWLV